MNETYKISVNTTTMTYIDRNGETLTENKLTLAGTVLHPTLKELCKAKNWVYVSHKRNRTAVTVDMDETPRQAIEKMERGIN